MSAVERSRSSGETVEVPLEFETMLADLSSQFINLPPGEVDRLVEDALGRVCELLRLDLAVLWQWSLTDPGVIVPTHACPALGSERPPPSDAQQEYPWAIRQVAAGRTVVLSSLAELPVDAAVDRASAARAGIKSNLTLPLVVGGEPPVGALAFSDLRVERAWSAGLVNRLRLVAQVFTNAIVRKRHDLVARESAQRLAAGAELAGLAFYEVEFSIGLMYADSKLRELFGVPPAIEGIQVLAFWLEHLNPADRPRVLELREQLHAGTLDRLSTEYCYLHPTEGEKWIHHVAVATTRDASGRAIRTFGVVRDVTDRKHREYELRNLSERLIRAQEEERAVLARELHDDVTQRLAVLAIELGRAEFAAPDAAQAGTMRRTREELVHLSEDIHSLAYHLHPSVLDELGLAEALRTECERRRRQGRIDVAADLDLPPAGLGKDGALCLFRIAQEALNNVVRHSGAPTASVTLRQMGGGVLLAVRDEGIGFDPEHSRGGRHLGLVSMRERVRLVNGTLDIESAPGRGTTIVAWVPVEGASQ